MGIGLVVIGILVLLFIIFHKPTENYKPDLQEQLISISAGTEDFALDTSQSNQRLLISCSERRDRTKEGFIYTMDLETDMVARMPIRGMPGGFRPHGICVVRIAQHAYLYVISHHLIPEGIEHRIYKMRIGRDSLIVEGLPYTSPLFGAINDLYVHETGEIFVTNPYKNTSAWSMLRASTGSKIGNVLYYGRDNKWKVLVEKLSYPNGVIVLDDYLWIAEGGKSRIIRYSMDSDKITRVEQVDSEIQLGDNFSLGSDGKLYITAHPGKLAFMQHAKNPEKPSPTEIYSIDPVTLNTQLLYRDDGKVFSAASTACKIGNVLYASQVFDPYILKLEN